MPDFHLEVTGKNASDGWSSEDDNIDVTLYKPFQRWIMQNLR
jgi:hypothetical protein